MQSQPFGEPGLRVDQGDMDIVAALQPAGQTHGRTHAGVSGAEDEDLLHRASFRELRRLDDHETHAEAGFVTWCEGFVRNPSSSWEFVLRAVRLTNVHAPGNTRKIGGGGLSSRRRSAAWRAGPPSRTGTRRCASRRFSRRGRCFRSSGRFSTQTSPPCPPRRSIELEDQRRPEKARAYRAALAINLLLNGGWTWLFFNRRKLGASAVAAAALTASSADLTRRAVEARAGRGAPLVLYPLWCAFATALSTRIWLLNR